MRTRHGTREATDHEIAVSIRVLRRMLHPAPVAAAVASSFIASPPTSTPTGGGGGYAIDSSIVMCESGGDYNAVNPSSGAYGAYQILPSTSAGLGCDMSTHSGQDQCAAKVMATQGRGAWVC